MLLSIVVLALSLSLDALGVGIAYGLRKVKIPLKSAICICMLSMMYAWVSLFFGKSLTSVLTPAMSKFIGLLILTLMGIWIIIQGLIKKEDKTERAEKDDEVVLKLGIRSLGVTIQVIKNPVRCDIDHSGTIDLKESLLLGLALSMDAIGVGIGSALAGFHGSIIPLTIGVCQFALLYVGLYLGNKVVGMKVNKKLIAVLPGILLILLAILRIS